MPCNGQPQGVLPAGLMGKENGDASFPKQVQRLSGPQDGK